jgi:hypothetical protein
MVGLGAAWFTSAEERRSTAAYGKLVYAEIPRVAKRKTPALGNRQNWGLACFFVTLPLTKKGRAAFEQRALKVSINPRFGS